MTTCYVSIGSNLDRDANILAALELLEQHFGELACSSIYESAAVGFNGPRFYNLVASFRSQSEAIDLSTILRKIEHQLGRQRNSQKFSSRTIDLDLILYGDSIIANSQINIPRDDITLYAFVLEPLAEIAGELKHPLLDKTYRQLWLSFDKTDIEQQRVIPDWLNRFTSKIN